MAFPEEKLFNLNLYKNQDHGARAASGKNTGYGVGAPGCGAGKEAAAGVLVLAFLVITAPVWVPISLVVIGPFIDICFLPVALIHDLFVYLFYPPEDNFGRIKKRYCTKIG